MGQSVFGNSLSRESGERKYGRWLQLVIGVVCMVMVANLQYGWTLFVNPMDQKYQWGRPAIQVAFTVFVVAQTWLAPFEGYVIDRFGQSLNVFVGGFLVGCAWVVNSLADSLAILYAGAALGGIGAGMVMISAFSIALKWFPERRGLALGLVAAGYGAGSSLTIIPVAHVISTWGYASAFFVFGLIQGGAIILCSLFLRKPPQAADSRQDTHGVLQRDYRPVEVLRTPVFWVMYAMFVMVCAGGIIIAAQIALIATDLQVAKVPVSVLGITLPALSFALAFDRITNGISRPLFGWISDRIGREKTMLLAFSLEAASIYALCFLVKDPLMFILLSGVVFLAWGEIFSIFPALCTDIFGSQFATTNYGLLYTAKGTASLLVPLSSVLVSITGSWDSVFILVALFDVFTAIMAVTLLPTFRKSLR